MNLKAARLLDAFAGLGSGATVVEIGCARYPSEVASDGWSTVHLAHAAEKRGWVLHSVDMDPGAAQNAMRLTDGLSNTVYEHDGERWLLDHPEIEIDGLYLDGAADPEQALAQYQAAVLAAGAVVVIDDVQRIGTDEHGKGNLLLERLAADGYTVAIHDTEPGYLMAVAA